MIFFHKAISLQQLNGISNKLSVGKIVTLSDICTCDIRNSFRHKTETPSDTETEEASEVPCQNRAKIKCKYCGEEFESRKVLLGHKLSSHKDNLRNSFLAFYIEKVLQ